MNIAEKIREIESLKARADQPGYEWDDAGETRLCELEDEVSEQLGADGVLMEAETAYGWSVHPDWQEKLSLHTQAVGDYVVKLWADDIMCLESIELCGVPLAITEHREKAELQGLSFERPNDDTSTVEAQGGRLFVVLRNADAEELARYVVVYPEESDYSDVETWWRLQYVEPEQEAAA
jgi:hypothetical protein